MPVAKSIEVALVSKIVSAPVPPVRDSPAAKWPLASLIVSSPAPPSIVSAPLPPLNVSSLDPPVILKASVWPPRLIVRPAIALAAEIALTPLIRASSPPAC